VSGLNNKMHQAAFKYIRKIRQGIEGEFKAITKAG
jgi:hypothetical protein